MLRMTNKQRKRYDYKSEAGDGCGDVLMHGPLRDLKPQPQAARNLTAVEGGLLADQIHINPRTIWVDRLLVYGVSQTRFHRSNGRGFVWPGVVTRRYRFSGHIATSALRTISGVISRS